MKKTLALVLGSMLAAAVPGRADEGHKHEGPASKGAVVTVTGEIVDLACYMDHEGKGKEHAKCAKTCLVDKRVPAGLLGDDGSLVVLISDHKHEKAFAPIPGWAAERVTVTGKRTTKGGLNAILVTTAEKAK